MPTTLSISALYPAVLIVQLVGLALCVRRQLAGFALVGLSALAYAGAMLAQQAPRQSLIALAASLAVLTGLGLALEPLSAKLRFRLGWIGQHTVWGGLIGGMIALLLTNGATGMLIGVLLGTIAVQFMNRPRGASVGRALIEGVEGFYGMFGPAGLRVLFAVVLIDWFGRFASLAGHASRF